MSLFVFFNYFKRKIMVYTVKVTAAAVKFFETSRFRAFCVHLVILRTRGIISIKRDIQDIKFVHK